MSNEYGPLPLYSQNCQNQQFKWDQTHTHEPMKAEMYASL